MSVTSKTQTTDFTCATCGADVVYQVQRRQTAAGSFDRPAYVCPADPTHDVGPLVVRAEE